MFKELKIKVRNFHEHNMIPTYAFEYKDSSFFVVSHENTRHLLLHPELVGIDIPHALKCATTETIMYFKREGVISLVNILNILRGGLNFPIEECCHENSINVVAESFLSSERVFIDKKVSMLETRYNKIVPVNDCSVVLGDIVASGSTLLNAIDYLFESYIKADMQPRNIIFFTVGTINTLEAVTAINLKLKKRWNKFNGIITVFYEGIFNFYSNTGITGLNLVNVDFVYNGAFLAPEFRWLLINSQSPLFEKCVIYDGGARRFEKNTHISSILDYWFLLSEQASTINLADLFIEKYGCSFKHDFSGWLNELNYMNISEAGTLSALYNKEIEWANVLSQIDFCKLCKNRYEELQRYYALREG